MDVRFTGYSDDLFHISYDGRTYEYDQWNEKESIIYTVIESGNEALKVTAIFDAFGVWSFAPSMLEEFTPLIPVRVTFFEEPAMSRDSSYCLGLGLAGVPAGAKIRVYDRDRNDITQEGV